MNKHFNAGIAAIPTKIHFSADATALLAATVGAHEPETYAMLGGSPDQPARVTHLRFLPAKRANASTSHVELDMDYVNHILAKEWLPMGITILGYVHSHPGSFAQLTRGGSVAGDLVGDIPTIKANLRAARSAGIDWPYALMPIVTFAGGTTVTGWIVTLEDEEPFAAEMVFEAKEEPQILAPASDRPHLAKFPIADVVALADEYLPALGRFANEADLQRSRLWLAETLDTLMQRDILDRIDQSVRAKARPSWLSRD